MRTRANTTNANAREWYEKGCELKHTGHLREAVFIFAKAIHQDTQFAEAYFMRGACYYMLGQYQLAGIDMDAATLLGCEDAQLWSKFDMMNSVTSEDSTDP